WTKCERTTKPFRPPLPIRTKGVCDGSGVTGRRISRRRFGERLRCFGRANIGLAQSLLGWKQSGQRESLCTKEEGDLSIRMRCEVTVIATYNEITSNDLAKAKCAQ